MAEARITPGKFVDIVFVGIRLTIGVIFIVHGAIKLQPDFVVFLTERIGFPAVMQVPIALAEIVPGILLCIGILNRASAALLSIIMIGAIFYVKGISTLIGKGGIEFELILLASSLVIMIAGPGRISLAHIIRRLPRIIH